MTDLPKSFALHKAASIDKTRLKQCAAFMYQPDDLIGRNAEQTITV